MTVAALAFVATTSSVGAQGGTPDPERAAVRQVVLQLAADLQGGNWSAADSLFAARGVHVLVDTLALHRWAEFRDTRLKPELARFANVRVTHSGVEAQVRGAVAWVVFRQEIAGTPSSGPAQSVARGSAVLEKVDGRWLIVHLHMSR